MNLNNRTSVFTVSKVEVLIAVIIIAILFAFAVPKIKEIEQKRYAYRQAVQCIGNLKNLQIAKESWATKLGKKVTDSPGFSELMTRERWTNVPACPAGGTYFLKSVLQFPTCSFTNTPYSHIMPDWRDSISQNQSR